MPCGRSCHDISCFDDNDSHLCHDPRCRGEDRSIQALINENALLKAGNKALKERPLDMKRPFYTLISKDPRLGRDVATVSHVNEISPSELETADLIIDQDPVAGRIAVLRNRWGPEARPAGYRWRIWTGG